MLPLCYIGKQNHKILKNESFVFFIGESFVFYVTTPSFTLPQSCASYVTIGLCCRLAVLHLAFALSSGEATLSRWGLPTPTVSCECLVGTKFSP